MLLWNKHLGDSFLHPEVGAMLYAESGTALSVKFLTWTLLISILMRCKKEWEEEDKKSHLSVVTDVKSEFHLSLVTFLSFGELLTTASCAMTSF